MKKNPFLTIMIIPHTEHGPKTMKISINFIRFFSTVLIIALTSTYLWMYDYTYVKRSNDELQVVKVENQVVINEYSKDYLSLYQDMINLREKMIEMQELEEQVRIQNGFDPTKSYFSKQNQTVISDENDDKSKVTVSALTISETKETVEILQDAISEKEKSLNELIRLMEDRNETLLSIPSIYPTVGRITSKFGYRRDPFNNNLSFHEAIDIANSYGTPIYATADGIVIYSGYNGGNGRQIKINHGNGFKTEYSHNSRLLVEQGNFVRKGELIAYMGSTGRSTGSHLDYRVVKNGKPVNPLNYIN